MLAPDIPHQPDMPAHRALHRSMAAASAAAFLLTSAALGAQSPTTGSNPRPRVVQQAPTALTQLNVVTVVIPAGDPGRFTLYIDGTIPGGLFGGAANVGNNGTTGFVAVSAGPHVVSGTGALGTNANDYATSFSANCPGGSVTLAAGVSETCTITNVRKHGSWTGGPGAHLVTVCAPFPSAQGVAAGRGGPCTIYGNPGQTIPIVVEVWGAGGGGGGGQSSTIDRGGNGGGGGGGGGYGKTTITATVPVSGSLGFAIHVGAGGVGGTSQQAVGAHGGASEVRLGTSVLIRATGGAGGKRGAGGELGSDVDPTSGGQSGAPGVGGNATSISSSSTRSLGLSGGNGAVVGGCHGGGGGTAGVGGGPGAINNGGSGGHGGYYNAGPYLQGRCTAEGNNNKLASGVSGANGAVKLVW